MVCKFLMLSSSSTYNCVLMRLLVSSWSCLPNATVLLKQLGFYLVRNALFLASTSFLY